MDASELMHKASLTAGQYFLDAVRCLDEKFGDGYAKANPALVAAFMATAASDFRSVLWAQEIERASADIANALE